jgi:hypothetical protein
MTLYDAAKRVFGMTNSSVFMPHISLYYGDVPYSVRQAMMEAVKIEPKHYLVDAIVVTPGGEHPPAEWEYVYTGAFKS